ncbi:MAG: hypothetical protein QXQ48_08755 [Nitrososphaerota archaeon]
MNLERLLNFMLDKNKGILRLRPTFVARTLYPALGRLGVKRFSVGHRGWLCERWMASSVAAVGPTQVGNEGLSEINIKGQRIFLRDALNLIPDRLLGESYAKAHKGRFGVLTKILDIGYPIPFHLHAQEVHAKRYWNMSPKEEAYYFLDHPNKGPLPYSHLGLHPETKPDDILPVLKRWADDKILDFSPAYRLNTGEGFHILAGVPHAPGTALTLEVQEESDVVTVLQAKVRGKILPKEKVLLNGPRSEEEALELINWEVSADPKFYKKYHIDVERIVDDRKVKESWIFSPKRSRKFSGKELILAAGEKIKQDEKGAFLLFVWKGRGRINGVRISGRNMYIDELFVSYEAAQDYEIVNDGRSDLVCYKIFGPDVYH